MIFRVLKFPKVKCDVYIKQLINQVVWLSVSLTSCVMM